MRLCTRYLPILIALAMPTAASAEATPASTLDTKLQQLVASGGLSSDQAAARAMEIDPSVRKKQATLAERKAGVASANLNYVPQLGVSLTYTRLSELDKVELMGFTIPQVLDNYSLKFELSVPLSDYFLRFPSLVRSNELRVKSAEVEFTSAQAQIAMSARSTYWQWVRAKLNLVISEQALTQVAANLQQMEARMNAQQISKADYLRVKAREADVRRTVIVAREQAQLAERRLRQAIGAGSNEPLTIGENIFELPQVPQLNSGASEALVERALSQRSEIQTIDYAIEALEATRTAQGAGRFPRLDAFATYNYDNPNQRVFFSEGEFAGTWAAGLRLSWKLNDFLGASPTLDTLNAQVLGLREDRENLRRQLELAVADAVNAVILSNESLESIRESRAAAEESYRIRSELFAANRATAVELIDAETEVQRARITEIGAFVDLRLALANLAFTLGETSK